MNDNPLLALKALGQHVWLDKLSRRLLRDGSLQALINRDGVDGVTSNPAIFQQAISGSTDYADDLARWRAAGLAAEACYEALVIPDIRAACDMLRPQHVASRGEGGYASLEVSPRVADDTAATEAEAWRLRAAVGRDNLLIKIPATPAGIAASENLTARGLRLNLTLIFSLVQYAAVAQAYLRGARRWLAGGGEASQLRAVASVFLSRVDTLVDPRLAALGAPLASQLGGRSGIALARCCHARYRALFHGADFAPLAAAGVRPQTPLWASTGTKNPAYSDVLYVEALIGPESINTMPDATLAAFRAHGRVQPTLSTGAPQAAAHLARLGELGIDLDALGQELQRDGLRLFAAAHAAILRAMAD